jgi:hypothetical protein
MKQLILFLILLTASLVIGQTYESIEIDGKYGVINEQGDLVIPANYDEIGSFGNGLFPAKKDSFWGFISVNNEIVVPFENEMVSYFLEGIAFTQKDSVYVLIDSTGRRINELDYSYVAFPFELPYIFVEQNRKQGIVNLQGENVIDCKYDNLRNIGEQLWCYQIDQKFGLVNRVGKEITPPHYLSIDDFRCGLASVIKKTDNTYSFFAINNKGEETISASGNYFDLNNGFKYIITSYDENLQHYTFEVLNESNEFVFSRNCNRIYPFVEGRAIIEHVIRKEFIDTLFEAEVVTEIISQLEIVDTSGNVILSNSLGFIATEFAFSEGLLCVRNEEFKYGFVDLNGKLVIPFEYDWAINFRNGIASVMKKTDVGETKWYYINKDNQRLFDKEFDYILPFSEGYASVFTNKGGILIDTTGRQVIRTKFDEIQGFSDGLCAVRKGDLWGFINTKGKVVIKPEYGYINLHFNNGYAIVYEKEFRIPDYHNKNHTFLIDTKGKVLSSKYSSIKATKNPKLLEVTKAYRTENGLVRNLIGVINTDGVEIIEPVYEEIRLMSDGCFCVLDETQESYIKIDKNGNKLERYNNSNERKFVILLHDDE